MNVVEGALARRPGELCPGDIVRLYRPECAYHGVKGRVFLGAAGDSRVGVVWWFPDLDNDFYACVDRRSLRRVRGKGGHDGPR